MKPVRRYPTGCRCRNTVICREHAMTFCGFPYVAGEEALPRFPAFLADCLERLSAFSRRHEQDNEARNPEQGGHLQKFRIDKMRQFNAAS